MVVDTDIEFEDDELAEDPEEFDLAIEELRRRCDVANINLEEEAVFEGRTIYSFGLRCGREKRKIIVSGLERIQLLLSIPFEKYVGLGDYLAICSYEDGLIEAAIRPINRSPTFMWRRLLGARYDNLEPDTRVLKVKHTNGEIGATLTIREMSDQLAALSAFSYTRRRVPSLKIEGISVSRHNKALKTLERIANSFFFQVDLELGVSLNLVKERRRFRPRMRKRGKSDASDLKFPRTEYDEAPMALYWYARSATRMPLLQFLAYYQSIEFYFLVYSQMEARRQIRNILKDPTFRMDRDADIGRLLSLFQPGTNIGNERAQLKATLHECLEPSELRDFITDDEERKEFLSSKVEGLTDYKIPLRNANVDLRDQVSDRIYDIRCKVVHTKGSDPESGIELLLPFSREASQMNYDIQLIEYVARQVIIAGSSPLHF